MNNLGKLSPPGIRLQLTLWYSVVSAALMLIFGIALYTSLLQLLASSFDTSLQMRAQQIAEGVGVHNGRVMVKDIVDELPELDATAAIVDSSSSSSARQTDSTNSTQQAEANPSSLQRKAWVRVLDMHSKVIYITPPFEKLSPLPKSITDPLKGIPWHGSITSSSGQPIRLYSTMLVDRQQHIVGVVQVGMPLAGLHTTLGYIAMTIILLTPFILILIACGSYWLAGFAFRPIHRLARTAREISAKDLHQRVPVPLAKDEVRELAIIFNQMVGRLERAFKQQRRFVADASHELRTPVAVIRSMTEVALSQPSNAEDFAPVLQEVNAESERLGRLINDLLVLARADEGHIELDQDPVRLDLLAADVVDSLEPLAVERKITLCSRKLEPATVLGDAARLIQVIMSLVDNGLIYTNAGGCVTVSVEVCDSHVRLSVRDTGIGIAQKDIEHIFERFYRADPARSKVVGGTGLGLAIVDWVVEAHKGTIEVESQPGKGSIFTIILPLAVTNHDLVLRTRPLLN
jgi:two-component system OmpR family sensor kinase